MLKAPTEFVIIFIIISVILILALIVFITIIIYRYQQKQNAYLKDIESLKASHQNALLQSQLEIQEQTLQKISTEIHDNIGQKLTLAKLHLNTLKYADANNTMDQVNQSVSIIGDAIKDLSNLSHSLSNEIILNNGLIKALECETVQLEKSGAYKISFTTSGNPVFLEANTELVIFRIIQEALNNIIKHACANALILHLHYDKALLAMKIQDNGIGFNTNETYNGTGLSNMKKRTLLLNGRFCINSSHNTGTEINIEIPLYAGNQNL